MGTSFKQVKNNATARTLSEISAAATSIVLKSGQGAAFPSSGSFWVTLYGDTVDAGNEIVLVTSRSSDTLTVTRAQQGTPAAAWPAGSKVAMLVTQEALEDIHDAINGIEAGTTALDALDVDGNGDVSGTLDVHDDAHLYGDLTLDGSLIYSGGGGSDLTDLTVGDSSNTMAIMEVAGRAQVISGTWTIGTKGEMTNAQAGTYNLLLSPPLQTPGSVLKQVKVRGILAVGGDTVNLDLNEIYPDGGTSSPSSTSKLSTASPRVSANMDEHVFTLGTPYTFVADKCLMAQIGLTKAGATSGTIFTVEWVYEEREY